MNVFILFPILFIIWGVIGVLFPRIWWYVGEGWKFKNVEPSSAALIMARIGGILALIVGYFLYNFIATSFVYYI
ncbi:DUF6199 family natural product biosynthesis protein [Gottfriedia solisilvae]|uniref:DUF6199 domain-containing protein n=1 Tax=Gottfriedia solisilvae TaxID=1516104 RepID=A0A8J3EX52_9BACI|nr:DUF6199 family natural product biosynthesis protein [Gottfriedia solisilvae]GGI11530.1 hypothetical protein GCM10007380_08300 [Gottfriedia solisilvae]